MEDYHKLLMVATKNRKCITANADITYIHIITAVQMSVNTVYICIILFTNSIPFASNLHKEL